MIEVRTRHPVALSSRDHTKPRGAWLDNSVNIRFNRKIYHLQGWPTSVLDLGCSGGAMIKSFLDQGNLAVGIEGSNRSFVHKRAEWKTIPDFLFTADITKPFEVLLNGNPLLFNVITAWEFLEHILTKDLDVVLANIEKHLKPDGIVVASINMHEEFHHRTVQSEEWWIDFIETNSSLRTNNEILSKFQKRDFVRGNSRGFHVVLQKISV